MRFCVATTLATLALAGVAPPPYLDIGDASDAVVLSHHMGEWTSPMGTKKHKHDEADPHEQQQSPASSSAPLEPLRVLPEEDGQPLQLAGRVSSYRLVDRETPSTQASETLTDSLTDEFPGLLADPIVARGFNAGVQLGIQAAVREADAQQLAGRLHSPPVRVSVLLPSSDDPKRLEDDQNAQALAPPPRPRRPELTRQARAQRADLSKMADAFSERIAEVQEQAPRCPRHPTARSPPPLTIASAAQISSYSTAEQRAVNDAEQQERTRVARAQAVADDQAAAGTVGAAADVAQPIEGQQAAGQASVDAPTARSGWPQRTEQTAPTIPAAPRIML